MGVWGRGRIRIESSSAAFKNAVLDARRRHPRLVAASRRQRSGLIESWVHEHWPIVQSVDITSLPWYGGGSTQEEPSAIDYAGVVHNRPMDTEDDLERVADCVVEILTHQTIDWVVLGEVIALRGSSWEEARRARRGASFSEDWRWLVTEGNHRIIAQHQLGIGPFARIHTPTTWKWGPT